jgi:hypothetical protein
MVENFLWAVLDTLFGEFFKRRSRREGLWVQEMLVGFLEDRDPLRVSAESCGEDVYGRIAAAVLLAFPRPDSVDLRQVESVVLGALGNDRGGVCRWPSADTAATSKLLVRQAARATRG